MCNIVILGKWGKNKYSCIRRQRQIRHKSQTLVVSLNGDCWGGLVGHMMDGITLHTYWLQCTTWTRDRFPITDSYEEPHFANIHTAMMIFATTWSYRPRHVLYHPQWRSLTLREKIYSIVFLMTIDNWWVILGSHGISVKQNLLTFTDSFYFWGGKSANCQSCLNMRPASGLPQCPQSNL